MGETPRIVSLLTCILIDFKPIKINLLLIQYLGDDDSIIYFFFI